MPCEKFWNGHTVCKARAVAHMPGMPPLCVCVRVWETCHMCMLLFLPSSELHAGVHVRGGRGQEDAAFLLSSWEMFGVCFPSRGSSPSFHLN